MNTKINESELISGKDALIALANGEKVECRAYESNWINIDNKQHPLSLFFDDSFQFRLKPHTIKVELEIPAPFEPKVGEGYFYLNAKYKDGYSKTMREPLCNQDNKNIENGAWRTEEEIKQVVAALRQIFGDSHD